MGQAELKGSQDSDVVVQPSTAEAVNKEGVRSLYKKREKIHPRKVKGTFRRLKWLIMALTLGVYYLVPWIRWDRGEGIPNQAVLIDFSTQRFYFFFIEIWPQEVYYITGLLILAAIGLFLMTSVAGRVWCGYSCPQTVWTDLFMAVESFVEGDRAARIRLDRAPFSVGKFVKRLVKHALWILIALSTGGAWVFYFADAPALAADLIRFEAIPVAYITIGVLTATTYVLGGFMREQVCTYMCPWPRIQGALLDEESLIVSYKTDRGETRGPYRKGDSWENRGDCVDCKLCVAVCPMGIDIRDGQQLECITCALCIDACDTVMKRIGRPRGLIDYDTFLNDDRRKKGEAQKIRIFRPRTLVYVAILALVGAVMLAGLLTRSILDINVLHDRNPLFTELSDGSIRNGYTLKILNKLHEQRLYKLSIPGFPNAEISAVGNDPSALSAPSNRLASYRVFVTLPTDAVPSDKLDMEFTIIDTKSGEKTVSDTIFRGPKK